MAQSVKIPTRDVVNLETQGVGFSEVDYLLFRQIGSIELINLVRSDTITGKNVSYSIVTDLQKTQMEFDPSLILFNKSSYQSIFNGYQISLFEKTPTENFYNESELQYKPANNLLTNAYWTGQSLILEVENLRDTEIIEIQLESDGKMNRVRENDYQ